MNMNALHSKLQSALEAGDISEAFAKRIKAIACKRSMRVSQVPVLTESIAILRSARNFYVIAADKCLKTKRYIEMDDCYIIVINNTRLVCWKKNGDLLGYYILGENETLVLDNDKRLGNMLPIKDTKSKKYGVFDARIAGKIALAIFDTVEVKRDCMCLSTMSDYIILDVGGREVKEC